MVKESSTEEYRIFSSECSSNYHRYESTFDKTIVEGKKYELKTFNSLLNKMDQKYFMDKNYYMISARWL